MRGSLGNWGSRCQRLSDQPALRFMQRYVSPSSGLVVKIASLRRPEFALRFTSYPDIVVDERVLTASFPFVSPCSRSIAVALIGGELTICGRDKRLQLSAGDSALLGLESMQRTRWTNTAYLDLEWTSDSLRTPTVLRRLAGWELDRAVKLGRQIEDPSADQRSTLVAAFDLFGSIGAPLHFPPDALAGTPTDRDRRVALVLEQELESLASQATLSSIADSIQCSPRHVRRIVRDFSRRYRCNARSWRDIRNRWRLQIAVLLLSRPRLRVAQIAEEVGYASPNGLTRALTKLGFPPPAVIRKRLGHWATLSST